MSTNPYAAPEALPETLQTPGIGGMPYASQNKRLLNFIIDSILLRVVITAVAFAAGATIAAGNLQVSELALNIFAYGLAFFVYFAYFILLEGAAGITIGKLLTGTRVIDAAGGPPKFGQILGRTASRIIPFEPLSFLVGDKTTGWHDSLSGTRVVDTRRQA